MGFLGHATQTKTRWNGTGSFLICLIVVIVLLATACNNKPAPKQAAKDPDPSAYAASSSASTKSNFQKKIECQKYEEQLEKGLEQDQFKLEALYRVFYSSKRDSCLAAKYTIFHSPNAEKEKENAEIVDVLDQQQVWSLMYPCEPRHSVNGDGTYTNPPKYEFKCTRYFWEVQSDLDEQIAKLE